MRPITRIITTSEVEIQIQSQHIPILKRVMAETGRSETICRPYRKKYKITLQEKSLHISCKVSGDCLNYHRNNYYQGG
jgi:hypothetical protein